MQGDKVIVRAFRGKPLVRRVWESDAVSVFIHSEDQYRRRLEGIAHLWAVCFLRSDVFQFQELPEGVEGTVQDEAFWASLTPYTD
jgi:hypothetical protein